jgi:hypothetical protein
MSLLKVTLISAQLVKNIWPSMDPEGLLRCSHNLQVISILSQINPVHILLSHFSEIHFNITLQSPPRSEQLVFRTRSELVIF